MGNLRILPSLQSLFRGQFELGKGKTTEDQLRFCMSVLSYDIVGEVICGRQLNHYGRFIF